MRALVRVAGIVALLALAVLGVRFARARLLSSDHFAVRHVEVRGLGRLQEARVLEAAKLQRGMNVFRVDPAAMAKAIEEIPWVRRAKVARRLPDRVRIEIEERVAVALLSAGPLYLVDERGEVFKRLAGDDPTDLPIVSGISRDRFRTDRESAAEDLLAGLGVLRAYDEMGIGTAEPVSEAHLDADGGWSLFLARDGGKVRLGRAPFRQKLRRLRLVQEELRKGRARADYVLLDNRVRPDRATVRIRPKRPPRAPDPAPQGGVEQPRAAAAAAATLGPG